MGDLNARCERAWWYQIDRNTYCSGVLSGTLLLAWNRRAYSTGDTVKSVAERSRGSEEGEKGAFMSLGGLLSTNRGYRTWYRAS